MGVPVVACVASAGGLGALSALVSGLPSDFDAAVIALMHQDPARPLSALSDLLAKHSALPCAPARSGEPLKCGEVVVVPPGKQMLIASDRHVELVPSGPKPPSRPSADLLLTTLALAAGPDVIAVILSGNGHDGTTGAAVVHHLGGTVVATDEATTEVFGMPRAVTREDDVVDHVVPLGELSTLIVELAANTRPV